MIYIVRSALALLAFSAPLVSSAAVSKTPSTDAPCVPCDSYAACFGGQPKNAVEMTQTEKTIYKSTFTTGAVDMLTVTFDHLDSRVIKSTPSTSIDNKVDSDAFIGIYYYNSNAIENGKEADPTQVLFHKIKAGANCKLASPMNLQPKNVFSVRYDYPALDA